MTSSSPELQNNPALVAEQQRTIGNEWADIFEAAAVYDGEIITSAEMALRNPTVYVQDVSVTSMSPELQDRWNELFADADEVVKRAETQKDEWAPDTTGIGKLQHRLFVGALKPEYGSDIARVINKASVLFADSSTMKPGNTAYYAGNVQGMEGSIRQYRTET